MMAHSMANGTPTMEAGDSFEIQEIMNDDTPPLNIIQGSVHSGSSSPVVGNMMRSAPLNHPPNPSSSSPLPPNTFPQGGLTYTTSNVPPASSTVPLNSPGSPSLNGSPDSKLVRTPQSKIDTIKQWSISTYKCTRQIISERLGKTSRTVDPELEAHIESLRETQRKYAAILRLARALTSHFYHVVQTQHALGDVFADLAQKSPELQEEFLYNADTQRNLTKNGETLLGALNFFVSTVNTLCNKTMEDTLLTIKQYETARIEYDAYRTDLELLIQAPGAEPALGGKLEDAHKNFGVHKERFEQLRQDVAIKLKFLEENKVKVMHKQLLLFHNAVSAYFSGNQQALEATLKQFNIKLKAPNSGSPSWIEQ